MASAPKNGLRISELARRAGVSPPTVNHYLREGLLPKPIKTGRTMAYYDPACVDRIRRIKKLQKEQFFPLEMIKRVLDAGGDSEDEIAVGLVLAKSDKLACGAGAVSEEEAARQTGLSLSKIRRMEKRRLIDPCCDGEGKRYDPLDMQILEIARRREALGLPFDEALETMEVFHRALEKAVQEDVRRFTASVVGNIPVDQALRRMREADDDLDRYVVLVRHRLLRSLGRDMARELNLLQGRLAAFLVSPLPPASLPADEPVRHRAVYRLLTGDHGLAARLALEEYGPPRGPALAVAACLAGGKVAAAAALVDRHFPGLQEDALAAAAAALTRTWQAARAEGFSAPVSLAKQAVAHLAGCGGRKEPEEDAPENAVCQFVRGGICALLPDLFGMREEGMRLLEAVAMRIQEGRVSCGHLPAWLSRALETAVFPEMLSRVRRLLAAGDPPPRKG